MADIFRFENLSQQPNLIHGVAKAGYGNMSFRFGDINEVRTARQKFFDDLDVPNNQVAVTQLEHGHRIVDVTTAERGRGNDSPETVLTGDILITDQPDTFLFFVVADCLGIFYFDPVKRIAALAHAGWKGVSQMVPSLTIEHLVKNYGCDPKNLIVGLSPALQAKSAQFTSIEQVNDPKWTPYIRQENGVYQVDTPQFASDQLIQAGIKAENLEMSSIDTFLDKNFFSHRRSEKTGEPEKRFGCLIGWKS